MKYSCKIIAVIALCTICSAITFAGQGKMKSEAPTNNEAPAPPKHNSAAKKKAARQLARKNVVTEAHQAARHPGKDSYGREYVDLGLPSGVLWATCNVGASPPWQTGLYFA